MLQTDGFTILEMMVVLVVVSIIMFVMSLMSVQLLNDSRVKNTVEAFGVIYNNVQSACIVNSKEGYVKIIDNTITGYVGDEVINQIDINENVDIDMNYGDSQVSLNKFGNINKAGTIIVTSNESVKKLVFSIGEGRYYIE